MSSSDSASSLDIVRVVVVGAGPAGLLASILLLRRNLGPKGKRRYHVTLVDPGPDTGKLDEEQLKRKKAWSVSLCSLGLSSIKEVPGLFEQYIAPHAVKQAGVYVVSNGRTMSDISVEDHPEPGAEAYFADRNHICHAMTCYLSEHFGPNADTGGEKEAVSGFLVTQFRTRALFVDRERQCVITRKMEGSEIQDDNLEFAISSLSYDLLLGCDGVHSVVRNAFLVSHRDFEMTMRGVHTTGKTVNIKNPFQHRSNKLGFILNSLPGFGSFVLPNKDGTVDFGFGIPLDKPIPDELKSDDPKVIEGYMCKNLKGADGIDYQDLANKWVLAEYGSASQVQCNFYHSHKLLAVILGDAAHAAIPNIGQGMNTALADALVLRQVLDKHEADDNLDAALAQFSEERVKEGNALTSISFNIFPLSPAILAINVLSLIVRGFLNKIFPTWLVKPSPFAQIYTGRSLSDAYEGLSKMGYLHRSRQSNDDIMRRYFEKKVGMIKE